MDSQQDKLWALPTPDSFLKKRHKTSMQFRAVGLMLGQSLSWLI